MQSHVREHWYVCQCAKMIKMNFQKMGWLGVFNVAPLPKEPSPQHLYRQLWEGGEVSPCTSSKCYEVFDSFIKRNN